MTPPPRVVLASASQPRTILLTAAGVVHDVDPAHVDEAAVKEAMAQEKAPPAAVAELLAETKAQQVSRRHPQALVIGADQILACNDVLFDKPADLDHARAHLMALRGRGHFLHAGICVVRDGQRIWHHNDTAELTMRQFSDAFLDSYLAATGAQSCQTVGAYQLEGLGAQLFSKIRGDYFTILGLPLLPLLDFLRNHQVIVP
ncbi:MAG: Maf family protein [Alphaproteobacteria bacterium]